MTVRVLACNAISVYWWVMFARVLLSWFPRLPEPLVPIARIIYALTEPVLRLVRPLAPPVRIGMMALDTSIFVVWLLLYVLQRAIC